ncbi:hypothetical protein [Endozoicomonas sp. ISHI1]|uniref:hypothetical protein n=1 Tax=Endozoicomonas sp. ISHI1 TaxID=2825882 RepID=UPI002149639B|nr:hypothetical protein [Endozoicomonas sp. ISHI1]
MSNSVAQLHKTAKQPICFHRDKTNQLFATFLGLSMMACPCSKLLAANPFSTPMEEIFVIDKTTKASGFLDDLINHNAYMGNIPPFALNPNTTHLIFAMNHENERDKKVDEHSGESAGASAQQTQPLIEIPLPLELVDHACMSSVLYALYDGLDEDTIGTILSYIPEYSPKDKLTIADMIQQLIKTLHITLNENQNDLMAILYSLRGTESPFHIPELGLAALMASYYAAIHSNGASPEAAHFFFNSFLLNAIELSDIWELGQKKFELLGTIEPIKDHEVLKTNVKEYASAISRLNFFRKIYVRQMQQLDISLKTEKPETPTDPMIKAATTLLTHGIYTNVIPCYQRHIKSDERMLVLIKEYGEKKPELVASNNQFVNLINTINRILDPFSIIFAERSVKNLSSYFSKSNWDDTVTSSTNRKDKEQKLFEMFEKVLNDAEYNPGNGNPQLFQELLTTLSNYIEQQLQKTFPDANDYRAIMVTLGTGFADLLEQSQTILAMPEPTIGADVYQQADGAQHDKAAKEQEGKELNEEQEIKRKHLKERIKYLSDFVDWFRNHYEFAMKAPYDSDSDNPNSSDYDSNDAGMS